MIHPLTCFNGHAWEAEDADAPCPICGSAAESLNEGESSTWDSGMADELPPPPGAAARPLLTEEPNKLPTVPGYEIATELGHGGMGVVYGARHLALNRRVALKVIRGFAGRDEVARFRAEAEAVARLQHPNIVQIYEVGEHAGLPYLALEFVDGGSLAARLRSSPLSSRAAAELVATLARAVQHAHLRGVVHRDLKPGNILLTSEGSPKIADFGLAKLADDPGRSRSGQIIGTPAYMAPEQAAGRGDLVGPPADVWALGAILYECLTTHPPFRGANSIETVQQVLHSEPAAPARERPGIPRDLETICIKCLRKQPEARYRTAGDLADDLTRYLEGKPILARRTPWWERGLMLAKRRPAAAALVVVILVASVALGILGYRHFSDLENYNRELEAKNTTITRNNFDLADRNATITQKSRDLEVANIATTRERDRAEHNLLGTLEAVDSLLTISGTDRLAVVPRIDRAQAAMLERALQVCDKLLEGQADNPRLRLYQAILFQRSGAILALLQRYDEAQKRFDRALDIARRTGGASAAAVPGASFEKIAALTHLDRGKMFVRMGEPDRGREDYEAALTLIDATGLDDPDLTFLVAVANANLAIVALDKKDQQKAKLYLSRARQMLEELIRADTPDVNYVAAYATVLNTLGVVTLDANDIDRALDFYRQSADLSRRLLRKVPGNPHYREELARALANYGTTLRMKGYLKLAAEPLAEALKIREELARDHPEVLPYSVDLCWSYSQTGRLHDARGDFRTANDWFTRAIDRLTGDPAILAGDAHARDLLGNVYRFRASVRSRLNQNRAAAEDLLAAMAFVGVELRPILQADIGLLFISVSEVSKALAAVEAAVASPHAQPETHFTAARVLAQASKTGPKADRAEELARRAVAELTRLEKEGFFRDPKHRDLLEGSDLKPLHNRADFQELLARVGKH